MQIRKQSSKNQLTFWGLIVFITLALLLIYKFGERWLRHWLIYLSHADWARNIVGNLPLAKRVARRFVAGETIDEAMAVSKALNARRMMVTIDYLGESVTDESVAIDSCEEILKLLDRISALGVDANVSVKLTQLGLRIQPDLALRNMQRILARATEYGNRVRIDMEESDLVDMTLEIYRKLRDDFGYSNVGVVIQSYLYRSESDVLKLIDEGAWVRLCKGAYAEPPEIAFPEKKDTDKNYIKLIRLMLSDYSRKQGVYLGVATHDSEMIQATIDIAKDNGVNRDEFEFQMLYGIRREIQEWLVASGYHVRIYVPYGTAWYPYLVRRLAERPANLWFFVSNLFRQ